MNEQYYDPATGMPMGAIAAPIDEVQGRWPTEPTAREAFQMGGLAGMDKYNFQDTPHAVFGAYDRAQAAQAKDEAQNQRLQRTRDFFRGLSGREGPADIRSRYTGETPAQQQRTFDAIGETLAPTDVFDAMSYLNPTKRFRQIPAAAAAVSTVMSPDPAEAGVRDPRLWSPISTTKLRKPLSEMEHRYTDVRNPVPRFVNPEDLVGGYGLFTPWDLSRANATLLSVDNKMLERPVRLHGGVGFPEANPGHAAASEQSISRRLDNDAMRLTEETGKPVYIMPMTMSPSGVDASHHVADPLSQFVQKAKITKDDADAFDAMMRASAPVKKSVERGQPNWVGIQDPGFQKYISDLKGGMRVKSHMADRMALAEWQDKGFPDVAAIRHAVSEPALIDQPRNTVGMTISRYIPGQGLLAADHPSYPKAVAGQHMGQLASLIPFEAAGPSIAEGLARVNAANKAAGKKVAITPAYHMGKPTEGVPVAQYFDQQWADNIRRRWGDLK